LLLGPFLGSFLYVVMTGDTGSTAGLIVGLLVFPALFAWLFARRRKERN